MSSGNLVKFICNSIVWIFLNVTNCFRVISGLRVSLSIVLKWSLLNLCDMTPSSILKYLINLRKTNWLQEKIKKYPNCLKSCSKWIPMWMNCSLAKSFTSLSFVLTEWTHRLSPSHLRNYNSASLPNYRVIHLHCLLSPSANILSPMSFTF